MHIIDNGVDVTLPGLYKIINRHNNRFYIGSTKRSIVARVYEHSSELKNNHHANAKLQNSYNLHGKDAFVVEPLINLDESNILVEEAKLLKEIDFAVAYNIARQPIGTGYDVHDNMYHGVFVSPIGKQFKVSNMTKFCRKHGLRPSAMFDIKAGRAMAHYGWSMLDSGYVPYSFISPDGILYSWIHNLRGFSNKYNSPSNYNLLYVWSKLTRHCFGWRRHDSSILWPAYTSPDGIVYPYVYNSAKFAREHGLNKSNLLHVLNGRRKMHKGWTYNPNNQPPLIRKKIKVGHIPQNR